MSKIIKNTTNTDIELVKIGITVPASSEFNVSEKEYLQLSSQDSIAEITPFITDGSIVINDGINDLTIDEAIEYVKYANFANSIRFLSATERLNGFSSRDVQSALEELRNLSLASTPIVYTVTGTSTVSRTLTNFATVPGMSITPPAGKYFVIFNASVETTGVNTQAEISIGKASTIQIEANRLIRNTSNILGFVTLSTNNSGGGHTASLVVDVNGSEEIVAAYRHISGGSIQISERTLTCVRVFSEGELSSTLPITESFHGSLSGLNNDDHPQYLPLSGIRNMQDNLDLGLNKITNLQEGTLPTDAVNKAQLDLAISSIGAIPVDFSFQSAISVNSDSSFSAGSNGVAVKAGKDILLDILGSARIAADSSLTVGPVGSVKIRSAV